MQTAFRAGDFAAGVEHGLDDVAALLAPYFPPQPGQGNELPDKPVIL